MKCRKVLEEIRDNQQFYNIVYFGSTGLQNPYAVLFKINYNDIIPKSDTKPSDNGIITNRDGFTRRIQFTEMIGYEQSIPVYDLVTIDITLNNVDLINKKLNYTLSFESGTPRNMTITAYYYNKEMYESNQYSSIIKSYELSPGTEEIDIDILMMAKRWKNNLSSYAEKQEGVASSLIQRLTPLQGELWYYKSYGLPILSKVKDKFIYDSIIISNILKHPDVREIISFESNLENTSYEHGKYAFTCSVITRYNEAITLSSTSLV